MKTCPTCRMRYPDALEFCPQDGAALTGSAAGRTQYLYDPFVGNVIDGRYSIEAKLGEGGMGVVYAARHVIIDKRVAIKVLKKEAQQDETAAQRFIQEARSASRIGHPNIVDITDFGRTPDGSAYFVMEFLDGKSLGHVIAQGPIPAVRAIRIAAQIARGLQAAHRIGIVHRDLKPENVFLVERDGQPDEVKIVDFGIAKVQTDLGVQRLTAAGMVLGTPEYMSPEQATGKDTDHRVDEYALGCILYEMLVGDVPFRGTNSAGTLTKQVFEPVLPPRRRRPDLAIPQPLEAVVLKAMAKKPDDRYPTMLQLLQALDGAAMEISGSAGVRRAPRGETTQPLPLRTSPPPARETRRGPRVAIAVVAVAALLLAAVGLWAVARTPRPDVAPVTPALAPPPAVSAPVPPPAAPPPVTPTAAPVAAAPAMFTLRTVPPGAAVYVDGVKLGTTPVEYRRSRGVSPVEFVFKLSGHEDAVRALMPDGNHDLEVALVARRERSRPSRSATGGRVEAQRGATSRTKKRGPRPVSDLRDPFN